MNELIDLWGQAQVLPLRSRTQSHPLATPRRLVITF